MIKGCKRRMVIVSGLKDSSFETAYLIMKDSAGEGREEDGDIIDRANSLIESLYADTSVMNKNEKKLKISYPNIKRLVWFIFGFAAGAVFCLAAVLGFAA